VRPRAPGNCLTKCLCRPCSLRSNLRLCRPRPNPQMKDPSVRSPPVSWIAAAPIALGCYCFLIYFVLRSCWVPYATHLLPAGQARPAYWCGTGYLQVPWGRSHQVFVVSFCFFINISSLLNEYIYRCRIESFPVKARIRPHQF
jgi:hypothetical protein